jgi:hypothetical protein
MATTSLQNSSKAGRSLGHEPEDLEVDFGADFNDVSFGLAVFGASSGWVGVAERGEVFGFGVLVVSADFGAALIAGTALGAEVRAAGAGAAFGLAATDSLFSVVGSGASAGFSLFRNDLVGLRLPDAPVALFGVFNLGPLDSTSFNFSSTVCSCAGCSAGCD